MHSDILNYTKLAFNNLKMIQNDSLSANQTGDDRSLKRRLIRLFHVEVRLLQRLSHCAGVEQTATSTTQSFRADRVRWCRHHLYHLYPHRRAVSVVCITMY